MTTLYILAKTKIKEDAVRGCERRKEEGKKGPHNLIPILARPAGGAVSLAGVPFAQERQPLEKEGEKTAQH